MNLITHPSFQTQAYVLDHMEKFSDPLLRQLLWNEFYSSCRDAQLSPTSYLQLVSFFSSQDYCKPIRFTQNFRMKPLLPSLRPLCDVRTQSCITSFRMQCLRMKPVFSLHRGCFNFSRVEKLFDSSYAAWKKVAADSSASPEFRIVWCSACIGFCRTESAVKTLIEDLRAGTLVLPPICLLNIRPSRSIAN